MRFFKRHTSMTHLLSLESVFLTFIGFLLALARSMFLAPLFRKSRHGLVPCFSLPPLLGLRFLWCTLWRRINVCSLVTTKFLPLIAPNILFWYVPSLHLFKLPIWTTSLTPLFRHCAQPRLLPRILYSKPQLAHIIWTTTSSRTLFYYVTMSTIIPAWLLLFSLSKILSGFLSLLNTLLIMFIVAHLYPKT